MTTENSNPKQIADPDNEGQMIDNPSFDPTKNEDGTPVEKDDLAPIKDKLNKAYGERDTLKAERDALKKQIRDAELQKLKDEGKDKEHFEGLLADKDKEIEELKTAVIELTRDNTVQRDLSGYKFRNEKAYALVYDAVIKDLVQDDKGVWVHKSGKSISDYIKTYAEDEDNEFLFAKKENRGTDTPTSTPRKPGTQTSGKLVGKSTQEILRMAKEGKLSR